MKKKIYIVVIIFFFGNFYLSKLFSQEKKFTEVEYEVIAEGTDSPISNLQIVCFNKYFNKDYLPSNFREKYKLNDKKLYKKKMLIEVFHSDKDKKGLDKIDLIAVKENDSKLLISYNIINSKESNDEKLLAPFLILQISKSKKEIVFIVNGLQLGKSTEIFVD